MRAALDKQALTQGVDEPASQRTVVNTAKNASAPPEAQSLIRQTLAEEGQGIGEAALTLTHVRMAVGILKAREQALENAQVARSLIPIDEVGRVVEEEYATIRANFASMPGDIAGDLEHMQASQIEELLANKVTEILNELSADRQYASEGPLAEGETGSSEAAAAP